MFSRRQFLETGALATAGLFFARPAFPESPTLGLRITEGEATDLADFLKSFAHPPRPYQPKFRWWWPHGLVDPKEIRREIDAMADAGFGGAEIADVHHSVHQSLSPDTHGWGTKPWREAVVSALDQAKKRGLSIDHSIGPSWPASSSLVTPDSEAAAKELATGRHFLATGETYNGPVVPPDEAPRNSVQPQQLLALQAVRLAPESKAEDKELVLDGDSLVDLLPLTRDQRLQWTPPSPGRWIIVSYWLRGSAQQPERGPHTEPESYVVDHFSAVGTQAIIDLWNAKVLTPRIRKRIREVGGALFEDSIEMETHETLWTPRLLAEFERRRGYSLLPYLPLAVQRKEDHVFKYANVEAGFVLHDWWQTLSELFLENHFERLRDWAHSLGLQMRGQPYGLRTDAVRAAATLDIAEGESLGFKNLDDYRSLAGGRDMGGHKILSNEAGAYAGSAYATTWRRVLATLNPQFAAGVNQTVLHGFSYAEAPGAAWPGFAAFTPYSGRPGYAEAWGPRQPSWRKITDISGYFSRVHFLLQQGQPQIDVAFLRQKGYAGSGFGAPWFSKEGVSTGWTHEFISPATLELPAATVRDGRLAPDGPAFKLLVFEGDVFHGRKPTLELKCARKLLDLAEAGLPILAIGDWSQATPSGRSTESEARELRATLKALFAEPSVHNIPDREKIPHGLAEMDLQPDIRHDSAPLVHAQRKAGNHRFFYFCNTSTSESVATDALLAATEGQFLYQLDLWTGRIHSIGTGHPENGSISASISLDPGSSIAFVHGPRLANHEDLPVAISRPKSTPPSHAIELHDWSLAVEDWQPGKRPNATRITKHQRKLDTLVPWTEISGLEDVSGIGVYRTTFDASAKLAAEPTATLILGGSFDTYRIRLNGESLPPQNPLSTAISLSGYLKQGSNRLEIEVTTTLNNRLRVSDPEVYGANRRQLYGLTAPARIAFYTR